MTTKPENTERKPMTEAERAQIKFLFQMLGRFVFFIIIASAVVGILIQLFR